MQTNTLKPKTIRKKTTTVGRGGKRGKTSGRGTKGQNARAGHKKRPEIRDIIKKLPKLRGYRFNSFAIKPTVVTFELIEKLYTAGETVNPHTLQSKGVSSHSKHTLTLVKILNKGTLTKSLTFENCAISAGARESIKKAGGTVVEMPVKVVIKNKGGSAQKKAAEKASHTASQGAVAGKKSSSKKSA